MKPFIKINPLDNVIVFLQPAKQGDFFNIDEVSIILQQDVEQGHKVAIMPIEQDHNVIKYGEPIGHVLASIQPGQWIHTHNLKTNLNNELTYQYDVKEWGKLNEIPQHEVQIYRRANNDVAIRNELWLVPTVGCVNGVIQQIVREFLAKQTEPLAIDGIYCFPHQFGCSQLGDDHQLTKKLLQNMVQHPNAGGVLVVGLGCENNQIVDFEQTLGTYDPDRVKFLISQQHVDEIAVGVALVEQIYTQMKNDKRESGYLSEIRFGLECGGSDGLSGITANAMLGAFSDHVIAQGGTTVLTEVPEMFGAETLLMNRAKDQVIFNQIVQMINQFKRYYSDHNQPIYENPSPGNKKGGISTLEDKSLGCTQKSGQSPVNAVVDYGQRIETAGLNLLNAPGNDAIATSALAAAGCHMVLFSTGRGTPYGGFVPTYKIATNTTLATNKPRWIDFDAGQLVSSDISMSHLLELFITDLIAIVNGKATKNEQAGIRELAVWKNGVTL